MRGVRGEKATPGQFRHRQNWIGPAGCTPTTAAFVPPSVLEMKDALHDWEKFLHSRDIIPDLIQCALMHVQFETIHPFLDGNGRVGRLLITFFLLERKRLSQPLLYLSAYIDSHKTDYYELLQRVRTHGEWNAWLRFSCGELLKLLRLLVFKPGNCTGYERNIGQYCEINPMLSECWMSYSSILI